MVEFFLEELPEERHPFQREEEKRVVASVKEALERLWRAFLHKTMANKKMYREKMQNRLGKVGILEFLHIIDFKGFFMGRSRGGDSLFENCCIFILCCHGDVFLHQITS